MHSVLCMHGSHHCTNTLRERAKVEQVYPPCPHRAWTAEVHAGKHACRHTGQTACRHTAQSCCCCCCQGPATNAHACIHKPCRAAERKKAQCVKHTKAALTIDFTPRKAKGYVEHRGKGDETGQHGARLTTLPHAQQPEGLAMDTRDQGPHLQSRLCSALAQADGQGQSQLIKEQQRTHTGHGLRFSVSSNTASANLRVTTCSEREGT